MNVIAAAKSVEIEFILTTNKRDINNMNESQLKETLSFTHGELCHTARKLEQVRKHAKALITALYKDGINKPEAIKLAAAIEDSYQAYNN